MKLKFFISLLLCSWISVSQTDDKQIKLDSIEFYLSNSKNTSNDLKTSIAFAERAKVLSQSLEIDSLIIKSNINLSSIYLNSGKHSLFLKLNHESLKLATKLNDSANIALINKNLGYYYYDKSIDSAYFYNNKAEKLYRALHDNFNTATILLDIAIIQKAEKDFTGSELTSIEGIKLLDQLKSSDKVKRKKAYFYNNLGMLFDHLELYEESIEYHKKAIYLKKNLKSNNKTTLDNSKNNLALAYKNSGQYDLAIKIYLQILKNKNLINERPSFYALVLDNYAHALYLSKKFDQIPFLYLKALKISDSINYRGYNSIVINQHLAEYYNDRNQKDSAKYYGYVAKEISERFHNDDLLKSLLLLSKIEQGSLAAIHLRDYIALSDSLQKNERKIRNKFARIQYETKQIEQENIRIARERLWLLIISVVLIMSSFLLYVLISQRNKNKELQFAQQQQKTNEEIYNLMLSQSESIEEARTLEKKRISEELHDGILGRLFGTRLSLDSLNMNSSSEAIKTRSDYIEQLKTIEEDIRKVSHKLNTDFISGSGFTDIIQTLLETQTQIYELKYTLDNDDVIQWDDFTNKTKIHIYRILQEALHNIHKHAEASLVNISFKLKNNVICLSINDDGVGFDTNKMKSGIGLKNINSRIDEINGILNIRSEKNVGTTLKIEVPIN